MVNERNPLAAMDVEEMLVELQFHFSHRFLEAFRFQFTFPNDDDLPAILFKELIILLIPLLVSCDFVHPKPPVGLRNLTALGILNFYLFTINSWHRHTVSMPEAAIDKDRRAVLAHHDVRLAGDRFHVEAVAVAVIPQPLPHLQLGFGVPAADV